MHFFLQDSEQSAAEIFKRFDVNNNGRLSLAEVDKVLLQFINISRCCLQKILIISSLNPPLPESPL